MSLMSYIQKLHSNETQKLMKKLYKNSSCFDIYKLECFFTPNVGGIKQKKCSLKTLMYFGHKRYIYVKKNIL